jgi:glyoxylase-like metal-dependent hydrolase (beta-lactamase superfamily II)/8-oxo-dGTP pyrophosphatase MutT (NUDIX family)
VSDRQRLRPAAGIVLRRAGSPDVVYLVERRPELAFFGGYHAFPGGVVDPEDAEVPVVGLAPAERAIEPRWFAAAARELFEETGVLVARPARAGNGAVLSDARERAAARDRVVSGAIRFGDFLAGASLAVDAVRIAPLCRMITPPFSPARYDTMFFVVDVPAGQDPSPLADELTSGSFVAARDALSSWRTGALLLVPPAIILLRLLDDARAAGASGDDVTRRFVASAQRLSDQYARGKIHQVYFSPGIQKVPLLTSTHPPADHTNGYFVGEERVFFVDPGSDRPEEQEKMFEAIGEVTAQGRRFEAILLTHHHPDHVGAVPAVAARLGLPVWAHRETARALGGRIAVARALADGEAIPLGTSPDGTAGWTLAVLHTPGHAPGHLAFRESRYGALVVGDLVSTVSTIVVSPPEGHMATYLASLRRLRAFPSATLYPAHGPAKRDSHAVLDAYLAHRARREEKVLGALDAAFRPLDDVLARAYDDAAPAARDLARRSLLAGLEKLVEEGRVEERGGAFRRTG